MRNMMSQVKNWSKLAMIFAVLLMVAGCKDQTDPFVDPGKTEDPNWVVTVGNDMSSSMTAVVKMSFATQPGTLAAFMGNDCCGIAEYLADYDLYWLYISPSTVAEADDVQLRFYSPELKRIFDANEVFTFRNETQLGTVAEPFTPTWNVAQ